MRRNGKCDTAVIITTTAAGRWQSAGGRADSRHRRRTRSQVRARTLAMRAGRREARIVGMTPRVTSPRLVGREAELAALDEAVTRAADGVPSLTLLAGEAGVGKTRLVRELCAHAEAAGAIVVRGTCVELNGGNLPYAPIAGMLRSLPEDAWAATLDDLPEAARQALEAARLGDGGGPSGPSATGAIDRFAQSRLFEHLFSLVRRLSAEAPLVFALEDFHWVDRSTRDFIVFLAPNLDRERLVGVITFRTDEPVDDAMRHVLAELRRVHCVHPLELELFPRDSVAAQLEAMLGGSPDPELVGELYRRSSGNPFFVEELLAASIEGRTDQLPETLVEALLDRFRRASPDAQELLRAVAVVGRPLDYALLAEASGMPEPRLSRALRESLERQLVERSRGEEKFEFHHAVVREAIYGYLLPGERAGLHAAVARALQRMPEAGGAAELAFHWRAAGNPREALLASLHAGLHAERAHAFAEALRHFECALSLWDDVDAPANAFVLDRLETLAHVADLAKFTGDYARAEEACDDALQRIDPGREPVRSARFYERKGRCQSFRDDSGLGCYRRALELLPAACQADRARLLSAEALALIHLQRWDEAERRGRAALSAAAAAGARAEEMYARMMLGFAAGFLGDVDAGELHLRSVLDAADAVCHPDDMLYGRLYLGDVLRLGGRIERALEVMIEGEEHARRLGMHGAFGAYMTLNAAMDLFFLGRWREADARIAAVTDVPPLADWNLLLREQIAGQLCVARGDWERAERHLGHARLCIGHAPPEFAPDVFAALAELALWRRRLDDASAAISDGLELVSDHTEPLHAPVLFATGARVAADIAQTGAASRAGSPSTGALLDRLERLLASRDEDAAPPVARAQLGSCRAEAARADGAPAAELWREAGAAWRALGAPYPSAYAAWREAEAMLAAGGARGRAARTLSAAHATAVALGAAPLRQEIEVLARRSRIDVSMPAPAGRPSAEPASDTAGLTAREVEVLQLIAEGLTNGEIAERLYISPRTAGVHVSHILAKLNAANRTGAAAAAHRLGLLTVPD